MALSILADNNRIQDADTDDGNWVSYGSGQSGSVEGSFFYQGSAVYNRKIVTTGTAHGIGRDLLTFDGSTGGAFLVKLNVTDFGGLNAANGVRVVVGDSSTANNYTFTVAGTDATLASFDKYQAKGGFLIVAVSPLAPGLAVITGTPTPAALELLGVSATFSTPSAKSENVGIDAIDFGTGITLYGSQNGQDPSNFGDILAYDEGTPTNRFGYVTSVGSAINIVGTITIGGGGSGIDNNPIFTDSSLVVWDNGFVPSGYNALKFVMDNSQTQINLISVIKSGGVRYDATYDTRTDLIVTGSSGSINIGATLLNFRNIDFSGYSSLSEDCVVDGAYIQADKLINGPDVHISNTTLADAVSASDTTKGFLETTDFSRMSDIEFVQHGSGENAMIKITTPGTYTWDGFSFVHLSGLAHSTGSNLIPNSGGTASILFNDSGGLVTINITGGGQDPSVRNGVGATTVIQSATTINITCLDVDLNPIQGARVYLKKTSDNTTVMSELTDVNGLASVIYTEGTTATIGWARKSTTTPLYKTSNMSITVTGESVDYTSIMVKDE